MTTAPDVDPGAPVDARAPLRRRPALGPRHDVAGVNDVDPRDSAETTPVSGPEQSRAGGPARPARPASRSASRQLRMPPPQVIAAAALTLVAVELLLYRLLGPLWATLINAAPVVLAAAVVVFLLLRRRSVARAARLGMRGAGAGRGLLGRGRTGGLGGRTGGGAGRMGRLLGGGRRAGAGTGRAAGTGGRRGLGRLFGGGRRAGAATGGRSGRGGLGRLSGGTGRAAGTGTGRHGRLFGGAGSGTGRGLLGGRKSAAGRRSGTGTGSGGRRSGGGPRSWFGLRRRSGSTPAAGTGRPAGSKPSPRPRPGAKATPKPAAATSETTPEPTKPAPKTEPAAVDAELVKKEVAAAAKGATAAPTTSRGGAMTTAQNIRASAEELRNALSGYDPESMRQVVRELPALAQALADVSDGLLAIANRSESEWPAAPQLTDAFRSMAKDVRAAAGTGETELKGEAQKNHEADIERHDAPRKGSRAVESRWDVGRDEG